MRYGWLLTVVGLVLTHPIHANERIGNVAPTRLEPIFRTLSPPAQTTPTAVAAGDWFFTLWKADEEEGKLLAVIDARTGKLAWRLPWEDKTIWYLHAATLIRFHPDPEERDHLTWYDAATGEVLRSKRFPQGLYINQLDFVPGYAIHDETRLLDLNTGELSEPLPAKLGERTAHLHDGRLFGVTSLCETAELVVLDLATRQLLRKVDLTEFLRGSSEVMRNTVPKFILPNGWLVFSEWVGNGVEATQSLVAFDPAAAVERWSVPVPGTAPVEFVERLAGESSSPESSRSACVRIEIETGHARILPEAPAWGGVAMWSQPGNQAINRTIPCGDLTLVELQHESGQRTMVAVDATGRSLWKLTASRITSPMNQNSLAVSPFLEAEELSTSPFLVSRDRTTVLIRQAYEVAIHDVRTGERLGHVTERELDLNVSRRGIRVVESPTNAVQTAPEAGTLPWWVFAVVIGSGLALLIVIRIVMSRRGSL